MKAAHLVAVAGLSLVSTMVALPMMAMATIGGTDVPAAVAAGELCSLSTTATGGAIVAPGVWRVPVVQSYALTSRFGPRTDPVTGAASTHWGQDLATLPTPGPVVAASNGTVLEAGWDPYGLGNHVRIQHSGGIVTTYGHMATLNSSLKVGSRVAGGQQLGVEGTTGHSTGNHLHFEIKVGNTRVDPVPFMATQKAPLTGTAPPASAAPTGTAPSSDADSSAKGMFALPAPDEPRQNSRTTPAASVPAHIKSLYASAGAKYGLPWTLLAGVGMEETHHAATNATSSAGAQGLMQFMPATFAKYGVDGDGDGQINITSDADSIYSAANYLKASGATTDSAGVKAALLQYNRANWYVNDVLFYAQQYGGGHVTAGTSDLPQCPAPDAPRTPDAKRTTLIAFVTAHIGDPVRAGATRTDEHAPGTFFVKAYATIGVSVPDSPSAYAANLTRNAYKVTPGQEKPGDIMLVSRPHPTATQPNPQVLIVLDPDRKIGATESAGKAGQAGTIAQSGYTPHLGKGNTVTIYRPNALGTNSDSAVSSR